MIYSKVSGSKQTVLTPSMKKTVLLSDTPPARTTASPQHRPKQPATTTSVKTPTSHLKQTTMKTVVQQQTNLSQHQQQMPQKPITSPIQKPSSTKKLQEPKASTSQQKQQQPPQQHQQVVTKTPPPKKPEMEPIRLTVRKALAESLSTRIKEAKDLNLTEEEITELALQIEIEMYKFFKDTGARYKARYRSLVFNIKDTKNLTLYRKIAEKSLTPDALVKLSPEELASQELAEWREKENKHQLEMIKKNELDLLAQTKSIVVKTHKGEQIIENDGAIENIDPKTPVQDIVTALNSGDTISSTVEENKQKEEKLAEELKKFKYLEEEKKKKEKDKDREKRRERSRERSSKDGKRDRSRHRHSRDRERSREKKKKDGKHKDKDRPKDKEHRGGSDKKKDKDKDKDRRDKHKRSRSTSTSRSKSRHKDHKEHKHKRDEDKKKESAKADVSATGTDKSIEDRLWRHIEDETTTNTLDGNDSDVSDREPSSTVIIKTPDINEEVDKEPVLESKVNEGPKGAMTVWRGCVYMADVAKFFVTAHNVSGSSKELMESLPGTFDVVGRINPATVWDYIDKMKKNATKEILIIRLTAINDEEKIPYITLYSYLNSRNRLGVLDTISSQIKDFYIMPFSNSRELPSVLLPLDGPGFEENRQHLLLGIIVVHSRKKRMSIPPPLTPIPTKILKKDPQASERSYTPPPPLHPLTQNVKDESMSLPSSPRPMAHIRITQEVKQSFSVISKIVPELSSKITLESSSSSDKMQLDDDDEPYSPGEPVDVVLDDDEDALSSSSLQVSQTLTTDASITVPTMKNPTDLQRKMEELSRQIEEEKQQIQTISSSFLGDATATLPVRDLPNGA